MSLREWLAKSNIRRGIALSSVTLAAGGLVLLHAAPSGSGQTIVQEAKANVIAKGNNSATFSGPGATGKIALSHGRILAGGERRVYAEIDLAANAEETAKIRAPLAIAVVLDTSGSMSGSKIEDAKRSVVRLISDMRDDDHIAVVRYSDSVSIVQPLARVGDVRQGLIAQVQALQAGGGTNIALGLETGRNALAEATKGRVKRVLLASDGLDSSRAQSERIAEGCAGQGITVSSLGIGLDFDESYMGSLARVGRGNFAFVNDGSSLASFLKRELEETATTTIERARARIKLPAGVRLVHAVGAQVTNNGDQEIELAMGSLFAGDKRRVILELATSLNEGELRAIEARVDWAKVGGDAAEARVPALSFVATNDVNAVEESRDGEVIANAASVLASVRQMEAVEAYNRGEVGRAQAIIDDNIVQLRAAATAAPSAAATALEAQVQSYDGAKKSFAAAPPASTAGRAAAKAQAHKNLSNFGRNTAF